jgi:acyl-CoA synthetase (AMP-forming)/AMP-acid ligase II
MTGYKQEKILSVGDSTRYHAERTPDKIATIFEDRETTYGEYDRYVSQVANGLIALGINPQDRVSYLGKNCDYHAQIQMGTGKSNTVITPVNWRLAAPEIQYIIDHSDARVLFVGEDFVGAIKSIRDQLPKLEHIICLEGPTDEWPGFAQWRDSQDDTDPMVPVDRQDICFQLYTSGTTGRPKGVMLTNEGVFSGFGDAPPSQEILDMLKGTWAEVKEGAVSLTISPNFHLSGNGATFQNARGGGTLVIHPDFDQERVFDAVRKYGISGMFMVPAVLQIVLERTKSGDDGFKSIRNISYGASPIPLELMREAVEVLGCYFLQMYGMTEIGGGASILDPTDHDMEGGERMKSCGKAMMGIGIKIVDPDTHEELPVRTSGEIVIKSGGLMKGYYKQPEESLKVVDDDGWYYSGDAGMLDEEGYLYIQDRLKDMIVSGGENIYSAEVESALFEHEAIEDVCVIGVPSEKWGEEVKALAVLKEGASLTQDELIMFVRSRIAGFKVPKTVEFREELLRSGMGKLLKNEMREPYWEGYDRRVG